MSRLIGEFYPIAEAVGSRRSAIFPFLVVFGVVLAELVVITGLYQFGWDSGCPQGAGLLCNLLRSLVGRALLLAMLLGLVGAVYAHYIVTHLAVARTASSWPVAVNLLGVGLILLPLLAGGAGSALYPLSGWLWVAGAALATLGTILWVASPAAWAGMILDHKWVAVAIIGASIILPDTVRLLERLWLWDPLTGVTLSSVAFLLRASSDQIFLDSQNRYIGLGDFIVEINTTCSGYQGIGLVVAVLVAYLVIYRRELRMSRALLLLPIGILASFAMNILRIGMLIWIGRNIDPKLALDGFHSYAGWLFFTIVSMGLAAAGQHVPYFRKPETWTAPARDGAIPLRHDPLAAMILPFVAMMASGMVLNTFLPVTGLGYPLKVVAAGAVLAAFLPQLRAVDLRSAGLPIVVGVAIGLLWLATLPPMTGSDNELLLALVALSPAALAGWILFRVVGTSILVPIVEELFFRGYLFQRFDRPGIWRVGALLVSSAAFALLHDRWVAAFLAGAVYALMVLLRGRLSDAIFAHAATNAVIAAWAVWHGDWAAI